LLTNGNESVRKGLTGGWWLVTPLYLAGHCHRRIRRQWADPARVHRILEGAGFSEVSLTPLDPVIQLAGPKGEAEAADFVIVMGPLCGCSPAFQRRSARMCVRPLRSISEGTPYHKVSFCRPRSGWYERAFDTAAPCRSTRGLKPWCGRSAAARESRAKARYLKITGGVRACGQHQLASLRPLLLLSMVLLSRTSGSGCVVKLPIAGRSNSISGQPPKLLPKPRASRAISRY